MSTSITEFPAPDKEALQHSERLQELIRIRILEHGPIGFDEFMRMALYEPGLGYYSAGGIKIGQAGDFITAPEISSLFSICLARQCGEIIQSLAKPVILEIGAGTGVMARDLLTELARLECLPVQYLILESSADLRQRQQQQLGTLSEDILSRVVWLDTLPLEPFEGVILGNEVLDALPVKRFQINDETIDELYVDYQEGQFAWSSGSADAELNDKVQILMSRSVADYASGYCSEVNCELEAWLASFADCLEKGMLIFIDYGYPRHEFYHEQRSSGTLLCHYRHRAHDDPFYLVGLQDITASVDFTAVAEAAVENGLKISGFTSQAYFLLASGLESILLEKKTQTEAEQLEMARQIKLLTLPSEMGEKFKVIGLSKAYDNKLSGFSLVDHRQRL